MKSVLISIRPKWCEKIASGEKTIEVRKTRPKLEPPFRCYIYCTKDARDPDKLWVLNKQLRQEYNGLYAVCANLDECPERHFTGNGKVIGEFICDEFIEFPAHSKILGCFARLACLDRAEIHKYLGSKDGYGWHISSLKIYDKPKRVSELWYPPERYCEKELCRGCPSDQTADVNGEYSYDCEWRRPLSRPPQSWCYVEGDADG